MSNLLEKIKEGFKTLSFSEELKDNAIKNIENWLTLPQFSQYLPQLNDLIMKEKWKLLLDSFYQIIPFGTGGRRGKVGIGTNRINPYTIKASVQGHIEYLKSVIPKPLTDLKVVVAYDVRVFNDLNGVYSRDIPNPLLGLTSKDLAHEAISVYAAFGIKSFIIPDNSNTLMSTPELSFFIRYLKADAGLNISASHNHPDDNGGKFYNSLGGQEIPPYDEKMSQFVEAVKEIKSIRYEEAISKGLVYFLTDYDRKAYINKNLSLSLSKGARSAKIVFTPLHGTGSSTVGKVLEEAGFNVIPVSEQYTNDGNFPNVKYRIPNPEVPDSLENAILKAKEENADIVMATDPDADRIGVAIPKDNGEWKFLTGNEIACLITSYILETLEKNKKLPQNPIVIKTEVTTELISEIASHYKAQVIGNLLVGFKYIGDVLYQLETFGEYKGIKGSLKDFIIAVEESHGILVTPEIRDKDACGASLYLAELTSIQKEKGGSVWKYLCNLYKKYGVFVNLGVSTIMEGAVGTEKIAKIQSEIRNNPFKEVAGIQVKEFIDHWDENGIWGKFKSNTDRFARNVLIFKLENGAKIIIRPSGTEPKNKIYFELSSKPLGENVDDEILEKEINNVKLNIQNIADDFTLKMLNIIGVTLPPYGLRISGLVSLENKLDFVNNFIPELEKEVLEISSNKKSFEEVDKWIELRLKKYGQDARGLVNNAFKVYIDGKIKEQGEKTKEIEIAEKLFFKNY